MNAKESPEHSKFDVIKWLFVIALVVAGVAGNSFYSEESLLYRALALVALTLVAFLVALQTAKGQEFFTLFKEAKTEIRKVVWPTKQETMQSTMMVLVVVLIVGLMLWGLDSLLSWALSSVIG